MKQIMMKKRFFNMIEVCLALGVMAVGVIGAVAILPGAMKTSQIASNDVYIADAVNMIFSQIDQEVTRIQLKYDNDETAKDSEDPYADFENLFSTKNDAGYDNVCEGIWSNDVFKEGLLFTTKLSGVSDDGHTIQAYFNPDDQVSVGIISFYQVPDGMTVQEPSFKSRVTYKDGASNVKQYGLQPFFRAMVRIYSTPIAHDPKASGNEKKSDAIRQISRKDAEWVTADYEVDGKPMKGIFKIESTEAEAISMTDREEKHWRRVYVEFSYPVNLPISRRTKKMFIKEYYLMD